MTSRAMVHHLTRVVVKPLPERVALASPTADDVRRLGEELREHASRVASLMDALAQRGFTFHAQRDRIVAESEVVEAGDVKRYLRSLGFRDREFQVLLEYTRAWGVM